MGFPEIFCIRVKDIYFHRSINTPRISSNDFTQLLGFPTMVFYTDYILYFNFWLSLRDDNEKSHKEKRAILKEKSSNKDNNPRIHIQFIFKI